MFRCFDPDDARERNPGSSPGQALTQAGPNGTVTFGYDAAGRRTSIAYPAGGTALTLTYTWLVTGELTAIKQGATSLAAWAYDNLGSRTSLRADSKRKVTFRRWQTSSFHL